VAVSALSREDGSGSAFLPGYYKFAGHMSLTGPAESGKIGMPPLLSLIFSFYELFAFKPFGYFYVILSIKK
jgi:hypothetical protein